MNRIETEPILTVSQLTRSIKTILENEYRFVRISGEISNLKTPFSGHSYFTLKDGSSQIRGVLFKQQKRFVELTLKDGQEVVCFGRVTVYEPRGEYQLVIDNVDLFGTGRLQAEFERLKRKLSDRGYFSASIKKPLPAYPGRIVIISSPTGAAIQDFLKITRNRQSPLHIQILPVRVQGTEAAGEIAGAIQTANSIKDVDIIVLCRGGGSLEDLWAFNEEKVADAIHLSEIPVVTGIGHEIDFTIADFCADYRCPTPTGVAEKIVPDSHTLLHHIRILQNSQRNRVQRKITFLDRQLQNSLRVLGNMKNIFENAEYRLQLSKSYLSQAITNNIRGREKQLETHIRRLQSQAPTTRIDLQEKHVQMLTGQLRNHIKRVLERKHAAFVKQAALLNSVSPLATLERGYSVVRKFDAEQKSYRVISRTGDTMIGDDLNIMLHEGQLDCVVKKTR
jgi:exodeoxyribonuclease VII large subunit